MNKWRITKILKKNSIWCDWLRDDFVFCYFHQRFDANIDTLILYFNILLISRIDIISGSSEKSSRDDTAQVVRSSMGLTNHP